MKRRVVAGLDNGTYSSTVAMCDENGVAMAMKSVGEKYSERSAILIPLDGGEITVGDEAINAALMYPDSCLAKEMKPHIGEKDSQGKPIPRLIGPDGTEYTAAHCQGLVGKKMLDDVDAQLPEKITDLVAAIPADFTSDQRQEIMDLGHILGRNIIALVEEPVAAAHQYIVSRKSKEQGVHLINDIGAGTTDLSLVDISDAGPVIQATKGHNNLGGRRFDQALVEVIAQKARDEGIDVEAIEDAATLHEFHMKVSQAKHALSQSDKALFYMNIGGQVLKLEILRTEFEAASAPILDEYEELVSEMLSSAKLQPSDITAVIPVGPSNHMPMIQECLARLLADVPLRFEIDPRTAVSQGAALVAAKFVQQDGDTAIGQTRKPVRALPEVATLRSVSSHGLGCETVVDVSKDEHTFVVIMKENTPLPAKCSDRFGMVHPAQTNAHLKIMQGHKGAPLQECTLLATLDFKDLPPGIEDQERLCVEYSTDRSGIVHVEFSDSVSGKKVSMDVNHDIWGK